MTTYALPQREVAQGQSADYVRGQSPLVSQTPHSHPLVAHYTKQTPLVKLLDFRPNSLTIRVLIAGNPVEPLTATSLGCTISVLFQWPNTTSTS